MEYLKDKFSGCVEDSMDFKMNVSQHSLVSVHVDIPKFEIKESIFENGDPEIRDGKQEIPDKVKC